MGTLFRFFSLFARYEPPQLLLLVKDSQEPVLFEPANEHRSPGVPSQYEQSRTNEVKAYGVDGCRSGWFYFELQGSRYSYGVVNKLADLVENAAPGDSILIDIPIGLRDNDASPRLCDQEARRLLGPRRSSVFSAPIRSVLVAGSYEEACATAKHLTKKSMTKQAYGILPTVAEVDALMRSREARAIVREVHPEVCFWAFNGQQPLQWYKKKQEGFEERMWLMSRVWPPAKNAVAEALSHHLRKHVARDDVVDALVLAITAAQPDERLSTIPAEPETDSKRLPMEMVYARFD